VKPAVLTRDEEGARRYVEPLAALGLFAVPTPVTDVAPASAEDRALLAAACRGGSFDWVLVASARAVAPLCDAGGAGGAHVLAVGPATADALAARGITAEIAGGGAAAAADLLLARGARRVLVPRAQDGRDEALEKLDAAGVETIPITAYRTIARAADDAQLAIGLDLVAHRRAAVVALFAPSQVTALAELLAARGEPFAAISHAVVAAIGPTTALALREHGVEPAAVADRPEPQALASAVAAVYPSR
jgi:uroporphyrinogen-III synthase